MKLQFISKFHLGIVLVATSVLAVLALLVYKWTASPDLPKVKGSVHFSPYLDFNLAVEGGQPIDNTHFSGTAKSIINISANP